MDPKRILLVANGQCKQRYSLVLAQKGYSVVHYQDMEQFSQEYARNPELAAGLSAFACDFSVVERWGDSFFSQFFAAGLAFPFYILANEELSFFSSYFQRQGVRGVCETPEALLENLACFETTETPTEAQSFGELDAFIGKSAARNKFLSLLFRLASYNEPILLTGETGVGKSFVAGLLHRQSQIALDRPHDKKLVRVIIPGLADDLLCSELFGHKKGAFTGAVESRAGRIAEAEDGSLFFDEVGDVKLSVQPALLDFLQEHRYTRVGENGERHSNARLIFATNKNLEDEVAAGRLRHDFYERISGCTVRVPALSERLEDIPLLAEHFVNKFNHEYKRERFITDDVIGCLMGLSWKNRNVRKLENIVRNLCMLSTHDRLCAADLRLLDNSQF